MNKAKVEIYKFVAGEVNEYHLMVHVTDPTLTYTQQVETLLTAYDEIMISLPGAEAVFKRYFLSDAANQADILLAMTTAGTSSAHS